MNGKDLAVKNCPTRLSGYKPQRAGKLSSNGQSGTQGDVDIDSLNEILAFQTYGIKNYAAQIGLSTKEPISNNLQPNPLFQLFPNPASTNITLQYTCLAGGKFNLYNAQGQKVYETLLPANTTAKEIQLPSLSNGLYNYKVTFANCKTQIGKLTILQ
jgi:Secretion system C-terminal sorting domain